jgi:hypothetical protein
MATAAPVIALATGLLLGSRRPASWELFAAVPTFIVVVMAFGFIGAALGSWLTVGFALGDFLLFKHPLPAGTSALSVHGLATVRAPLLIAYGILANLTVLAPLGSYRVSRASAIGLRQAARCRAATEGVVHVIAAGVLVGAWLVAAPVLLKPLQTWRGVAVPLSALSPLRSAWAILFIAGACAAGREVLEWRARVRHPSNATAVAIAPVRAMPTGGIWRSMVAVLAGAACGTFLLSGLCVRPIDALILMVVLVGVGALRRSLSQINRVVRNVARVPLTPRLALSVALAFIASRELLTALRHAQPPFLPMAVSLATALSISAVLAADRGRASTGRTVVARHPGAVHTSVPASELA